MSTQGKVPRVGVLGNDILSLQRLQGVVGRELQICTGTWWMAMEENGK